MAIFRQCFQYNLVIALLNIQIIIPSSSELIFVFWSLRHVTINPLHFLDYSENFIFPHFFQFLVGTFYYVLQVDWKKNKIPDNWKKKLSYLKNLSQKLYKNNTVRLQHNQLFILNCIKSRWCINSIIWSKA